MRKPLLDQIVKVPKCLNLSNLGINDSEIEEIFNEFTQHHGTKSLSLTTLFLDNNNISNVGAEILKEKLTTFKNLSYLDLQFNDLNSEGVSTIVSLKIDLPKLTLALHGNEIEDVVVMEQIENKVLGKRSP